MDEIALDGRILPYTLAMTVVVALLCGLLPGAPDRAWRPGRRINEAGRRQVSTRHSLQWLLVGTQMALSVTLLAGAGLLVRSFQSSRASIPGSIRAGADFQGERQLGGNGGPRPSRPAHRCTLEASARCRASRRRPPPLSYRASPPLPSEFELVEGRSEPERTSIAESRVVSPDYFATMRIPLIGGERCGRPGPRGVRADGEPHVRESLSRRRAVALGSTSRRGNSSSPPARIVGVVGDARERGLDREPGPTVYTCFSAPNPIP